MARRRFSLTHNAATPSHSTVSATLAPGEASHVEPEQRRAGEHQPRREHVARAHEERVERLLGLCVNLSAFRVSLWQARRQHLPTAANAIMQSLRERNLIEITRPVPDSRGRKRPSPLSESETEARLLDLAKHLRG